MLDVLRLNEIGAGARIRNQMRGQVFLVSGLPYSGKTRLIREILRRDRSIVLVRQYTTRRIRFDRHSGRAYPSERREYRFVSGFWFGVLESIGWFAVVDRKFGAKYGISRRDLETAVRSSDPAIVVTDVATGFRNLSHALPRSRRIFIAPIRDLRGLGNRTEAVMASIRRRMRHRRCPVSMGEFQAYCEREMNAVLRDTGIEVLSNEDGRFESSAEELSRIVSGGKALTREGADLPALQRTASRGG